MSEYHVIMAANGRIVVPSQVRAAIGMESGGAFVMRIDAAGTINLVPMRNVIAAVQAEARQYIPDSIDLAAELSADRRRAAADE